MSETDSFIDEVTEEVRRDRLFAMFRKYGWIAALVVVVIVGASAWFEWQKAQSRAAAQSLGEGILLATSLPDNKARIGALDELQATTSGSAAVLGLIEAASMHEAGDDAGADAKLAEIASAPDTPDLYRDLASMKRLLLNTSGLSEDERTAIIDRLSRGGGPFRTLALEQRGLDMLAAGDKDGALKLFSELVQDAEITPSLKQRVQQIILVLGGPVKAG